MDALRTYGKLVIIGPDHSRSGKRTYVIVECECGAIKSTRLDGLKSGATVSCGCGKKLHRLKHGHNKVGSKSSEYCSWDSMVQRCTNPKHPTFSLYGGRGVTVCERWLDFHTFFQDMGSKPSAGMSIERLDNNAGYYPENCVWATAAEQMRNTRRTVRLTVNGVTKCLSDWAREFGIDRRTIVRRLESGWTEESAVTTPTGSQK